MKHFIPILAAVSLTAAVNGQPAPTASRGQPVSAAAAAATTAPAPVVEETGIARFFSVADRIRNEALTAAEEAGTAKESLVEQASKDLQLARENLGKTIASTGKKIADNAGDLATKALLRNEKGITTQATIIGSEVVETIRKSYQKATAETNSLTLLVRKEVLPSLDTVTRESVEQTIRAVEQADPVEFQTAFKEWQNQVTEPTSYADFVGAWRNVQKVLQPGRARPRPAQEFLRPVRPDSEVRADPQLAPSAK
jgi:hypothetical protein